MENSEFTLEEQKVIKRWIKTDCGRVDKVLENEYRTESVVVKTMMDGKIIRIGLGCVDFYEKLLELPVEYRLSLMEIDHSNVVNYLEKVRVNAYNKIKDIFSKQWIWNETGEYCDFNCEEEIEDLFGVRYTKKQVLGRIKRKTLPGPLAVFMIKNFGEQYQLTEHGFEE